MTLQYDIAVCFQYLIQPTKYVLTVKKDNSGEVEEDLNTSKLKPLSKNVKVRVRPAVPVPVHPPVAAAAVVSTGTAGHRAEKIPKYYAVNMWEENSTVKEQKISAKIYVFR